MTSPTRAEASLALITLAISCTDSVRLKNEFAVLFDYLSLMPEHKTVDEPISNIGASMTAILHIEAQRQADAFGKPFWVVTPMAGEPFITANAAYVPVKFRALFKVLPKGADTTWKAHSFTSTTNP